MYQNIKLAADIQSDSIVDGEGLRTVIWTQGCPHHCLGCHNPETWNFEIGGEMVNIADIKQKLSGLKLQAGLTFSGGEPFWQAGACTEIAKYAKDKLGWNIWSWTGYTYEDLIAENDPERMEFLKLLDVLVDGPFVLAQRDIGLRFRGSGNQRLLRLKDGVIVGVE